MEIGQVKNKSRRGILPKRDRPDKGRDLGIFLKKQKEFSDEARKVRFS